MSKRINKQHQLVGNILHDCKFYSSKIRVLLLQLSLFFPQKDSSLSLHHGLSLTSLDIRSQVEAALLCL